MGGHLITSGLAKSEQFGGPGSCQMSRTNKCNVDVDMDCRTTRAVYRAECQRCVEEQCVQQGVYIGTTGCTVHKRTLEHQNQSKKMTNNPQSKHHWTAHPNSAPKFTTKIVKAGLKYNMDRFITESIQIEKAKDNPNWNLLNQKSEWGNSGLVRLRPQQGP